MNAIVRFYLALLFVLLTETATLGQTKPLWSIFWLSDRLPCDGYWNKPMTNGASMQCAPVESTIVSICPQPKLHPFYPYDQGKLITIIGYEIVQSLSVSTANGYLVVGSGHRDGADVFAVTGGVGTNGKAGTFPHGIGIPQGGKIGTSDAHIDVYGYCDSGTQQALVNILYTSP